jgi:rfaE bifunctional protein nucleotidyltransferase chain/domain
MLSKNKIVSLEQARALREELRSQAKRVGLCNGVFDLLHVGHIRYLEAARAMCDCLVVAVNSDRSTRELKGAGRPLVPEQERAEVVAGLAAVDRVVIFDGRDVSEVIRELRPDLQIKGTDYSPDTVPERALVESLGGRVAIAGDPKDHSTSTLAARLGAPPAGSRLP